MIIIISNFRVGMQLMIYITNKAVPTVEVKDKNQLKPLEHIFICTCMYIEAKIMRTPITLKLNLNTSEYMYFQPGIYEKAE